MYDASADDSDNGRGSARDQSLATDEYCTRIILKNQNSDLQYSSATPRPPRGIAGAPRDGPAAVAAAGEAGAGRPLAPASPSAE